MPLTIILVLALALAAGSAIFAGGSGEDGAAALRPDPVERIITRVEEERGLRFADRPRPVRVTAERARREAAGSLDADYPPARRRADADMLALLGLLEEGTDLGKAVISAYGEAVAGYYDPRSGRLRIVDGTQTANRVLYEMTLAHELTHALEDQRFGFDVDRLAGGGDAALAYTALVEGTATALMYRYADARFGAEEALAGIAASAFAPTGDLPPLLAARLRFPYVAGNAFVGRLLEVGQGRWDVADAALRFRPPESTEQVMHPDAYLRVERPRAVALRGPAAALGPGWSRDVGGTMGEWLTGRLLARAGGGSYAGAAAGWGGDRYALLRRGRQRALVVRWRWDSPSDEAQFVGALRDWAHEGLPGSRPAGSDAWLTPTGAAAIGQAHGAVTLALAPRLAGARRAARDD